MAYFLIFVAAVLRFLPHLPNFAPITAVGLFSGTYLKKFYAVILPLAALLVSDYFIGFYQWQVVLSVYASFAISGLLGLWLRKHKNFSNTVGVTLIASIQFYLITNFAVWAFSGLYPLTAEGLLASFVNALPFFRNTLLGDFFYVGVMFGIFEVVKYFVRQRYTKEA